MRHKRCMGAFAVMLLVPVVGSASGAYVGSSLVMAKVGVDYDGARIRNERENHIGFHAGYRFGSRIGLEASFAKLGSDAGSLCSADACIPETGSYDFKARRIELGLLGFLPLRHAVELFGKVGAGRVKSEANITPFAMDTAHFQSKDTAAIFGAGVRWRAVPRLSLRLQFDRQESSRSDASAFWAGATFSFGN